MSGSPKEKLHLEEHEEVSDDRELYLHDGRKLVVREQGGESLVEIRSGSGMVEVRIQLTEQGPVLQMESVKLQLKASEAVEIESPRVAIHGSETLELQGKQVRVEGKEQLDVESEGDVRVVGKMIYLN
jgi:hypothetical protein